MSRARTIRTSRDALIGRTLYPLLSAAGYCDVTMAARTVYADAGQPDLVEGFTRDTFIAMVESVGPEAIVAGLITAHEWAGGMSDLRRTADEDGTFHYSFFKATAGLPDETGTRR